MDKSKIETVEDLMAKFYDFPTMTEMQKVNIIEGLRGLGPGCVYDDLENDDQRKGAFIILKWIYDHLTYEGENTHG